MHCVHQLIPCFTPGDAMGQVALGFQRALRHLGFLGEVYAEEVSPELAKLVRPLSMLRPRPDDVVLYHHGIASSLAGRLMHLECTRGVVFHNITPARFYAHTRLAQVLRAGRAQLAALADGVDVSIGVSEYNAAELRAAGHRNVAVVPLYVEPERFASAAADPHMMARLNALGQPRLIAVSRVVPHKRIEDLLRLHAEVRRLHPQASCAVVGEMAEGGAYARSLRATARALGHVTFLGRVSHAQLVAAYRSASVMVSMSEHEGFGLPLVEAMAAQVPVLAYGAAAVPETMGGSGIVFDEKHFAALAEVVSLVGGDSEQRARLLVGQQERVKSLSFEATVKALGQALLPWRKVPKIRRSKRPSVRPRVAIVVQRYGASIVGGAEAHARQVAQHLAAHARVEVLTTCASNHLTWQNDLEEGTSRDDRVTVTRFPVEFHRAMRAFNRLSSRVFHKGNDFVSESHWLAEQGPWVPSLLRHLSQHAEGFDAVIFFTYLYAPTVWGVPLVAKKALVIPTAHDEPPLAFHLFGDVFELPQALLVNTPEEDALIRGRFPKAARSRVVGVGIEPRQSQPQRFRAKFGVKAPYLLCLGRVEAGKGVPELLRLHQRLVAQFHDAPDLVVAGSGALRPKGRRVQAVGRLDEQDKWDALAGAMAVVVPSRYESLSLVTLEAFSVGTPVLGNAASCVVAGQIERSDGGKVFDLGDVNAFALTVKEVGERRELLSSRAKEYARQFQWDAVMRAYLEEIRAISGERR